MFMNLHTLPAGIHMYTLHLADPLERAADPEFFGIEEYDVKAPSHATKDQVIAAAVAEWDNLYDLDSLEVIAIADQSDGYFLYRAPGIH